MTKYEQLKKEVNDILIEIERLKSSQTLERTILDRKTLIDAFSNFCRKNELKLFDITDEPTMESLGFSIEEIKYFYLMLPLEREDLSMQTYVYDTQKKQNEVLEYLRENFGPTLSEKKEELDKISMLIDSILIKRKIESLSEEEQKKLFDSLYDIIVKNLADDIKERDKIEERYKKFGLNPQQDKNYQSISERMTKVTEAHQKMLILANYGSSSKEIRDYIISFIGDSVLEKEQDIELYLLKKSVSEELNLSEKEQAKMLSKYEEFNGTLNFINVDEKEVKGMKECEEIIKNILTSEEINLYLENENIKIASIVEQIKQQKNVLSIQEQLTLFETKKEEIFKLVEMTFYHIASKLFENETIYNNLPQLDPQTIKKFAKKYVTNNKFINMQEFVLNEILLYVQEKIEFRQTIIDAGKDKLFYMSKDFGIKNTDKMSFDELVVTVNENVKKAESAKENVKTNISDLENILNYTQEYDEQYYKQHPEIDQDFVTALQQRYFENLGVSKEGKSKR